LKVLALNYMSTSELIGLIKKHGAPSKTASPLSFGDSSWIDFDSYSTLLSVRPDRLKSGYLDQLGFGKGVNSNNIRHCPECYALGYHCSLFNFGIVAKCPWHRQSLTESCCGCASNKTINCNLVTLTNENRRCYQCGQLLDPFLAIPNVNRISPSLGATIAGYCSEMVEWWSVVEHSKPRIQSAIKALKQYNFSQYEDEGHMPSLLGYAKSVNSQPIYWTFHCEPIPIKRYEWYTNTISHKLAIPPCYLNSDGGRGYRCIRRHIYKKYIYRHQKCLKKLLSLKRDESYSLRSDNVCHVAFAYLLWQMSIEGVCNIEEMAAKKKRNNPLRLMNFRNKLDIPSRIHLSYFGFFGLLHQVSSKLNKRERIQIDIHPSDCSDGYLFYDEEYQPNEACGNVQKNEHVKISVICPCNHELLNQPCDPDYGYNKEILDLDHIGTAFNFAWSHVGDQHDDTLFRFTYSNKKSKAHFQYLYV